MTLFEGSTAVVTGGLGGIGSAISTTLRDLGVRVFATGYDQHEVDIKTGDSELNGIEMAVLDVSDNSAIGRFAQMVGPVNFLVNCAGISIRGAPSFEEEAFEQVLNVNLTGTMRCCRAFEPQLARTKGAIVNIASITSFFGSGTAPGYSASKGGVTTLTKSLAIAWADRGIRVNAVAPGFITTQLTEKQIDPELRERVISRTPMRQWGVPKHIADAVVFLCSEQASFITGIILPVDGGYSAA